MQLPLLPPVQVQEPTWTMLLAAALQFQDLADLPAVLPSVAFLAVLSLVSLLPL